MVGQTEIEWSPEVKIDTANFKVHITAKNDDEEIANAKVTTDHKHTYANMTIIATLGRFG